MNWTRKVKEKDWVTRLHEPFFRSREDAEAYVSREIGGAVPEGWAVRRLPDYPMAWVIEKKTLAHGDWPIQEYCVRIANGLDVVIFTYGNNDVGGLNLHHVLHQALVIDAVMLRGFGLSQCLRSLFANHKPNEWGYT
jgi:hypothetical protein